MHFLYRKLQPYKEKTMQMGTVELHVLKHLFSNLHNMIWTIGIQWAAAINFQ